MTSDLNNLQSFVVDFPGKGIAHLQINRVKSLNSFDRPTWIEYRDLLTTLDKMEKVRIIIISGNGPTFSSGLDLKYIGKVFMSEFKDSKEKQMKFLKEFQDCVSTPLKISKPTIGLVHGTKNFGLALDLCVCYTVRIFTQDVQLSLKEIKLGLVADMGFLQRMPHQSGNMSLINRISLTGESFGADQSIEMGLVAQKDVVDSYETGFSRAVKLAKLILLNQDWCIKGTKYSIQHMYEGNKSVEEGLDSVAQINVNTWDTRGIVNNLIQMSKRSSKL